MEKPLLTEEELLAEISRIAGAQTVFRRAVERIGALLEREAYGKAFVAELEGSESTGAVFSNSSEIQDFLASIQVRYRSLYSVPLQSGRREFGKLIACFASPHFLGDLPRRIAAHAAEQLTMVLDRQAHLQRRRTA
jgi:hypothetical protein